MNVIKKKSVEEYWLQKLSNKETIISFPWESKSNTRIDRKEYFITLDTKSSNEISEFCNHNESAIQLLFISLLKLQLFKYYEVIDSKFDALA